MQKGELDGIPDTALGVGAGFGHRFVKRVEGGWSMCDTEGERVDGISAHDWLDGGYFTVYMGDGVAMNRVLSGAALADGEDVATNDEGKAIPLTAEHPYRAGRCEAAVSATDLTSLVRLQPNTNAESEPA